MGPIMKHHFFLLSFLVSSLFAGNVFAKCANGRVDVRPNESEILPANAMVVLSFFGSERPNREEKLKKNSKKKRYFFKSGKRRVEAKLVLEREGIVYLQAVKNLKVGRTYSLKVAGRKYDWKVGEADTKNPVWVGEPKSIEYKEVKIPTLQDSFEFIINAELSDRSPVFYDATMTIKGKKQYFVIGPYRDKKNEIRIGLGRCHIGGQSLPLPGVEAIVELTPRDFAGNTGETKTLSLTINSPPLFD